MEQPNRPAGLAHPPVGLVVLNWKQCARSLRCLEAVAASDYPDLRTYFVDNGSGDGSPAAVRAAFPDVAVIETGRNLGFSGGNNAGIRRALDDGCTYVVLLNNDALIAPDCVSRLVALAQHQPRAGAVQARIYHLDRPGVVQWGPGYWSGERGVFMVGEIDAPDDGTLDDTARVTAWVSGCAFLVPAAVYRDIGLLDKRFFYMGEDGEFSVRLRAHGYECWFEPAAHVRHEGGASSNGTMQAYYITRNTALLSESLPAWRMRYEAWAHCLAPRLASDVRGLVRPRSRWHRRRAQASLSGFLDYALRRFGDCPAWMHTR